MARKQITDEQLLKLLQMQGITTIIKNIVVILHEDIGEQVEASDRGIEMYAGRVLEKLKQKCNQAISKKNLDGKQRDLLELIESIKDGTEPHWTNKLIDK